MGSSLRLLFSFDRRHRMHTLSGFHLISSAQCATHKTFLSLQAKRGDNVKTKKSQDKPGFLRSAQFSLDLLEQNYPVITVLLSLHEQHYVRLQTNHNRWLIQLDYQRLLQHWHTPQQPPQELIPLC